MEVRRLAEQLVALAPDVIVISGDSTMAPLMRLKPKVPIVFNNVTDPVSAGFVESLAQPGGIGQLAVVQSVAPSVGLDVYVINLRDAREIEQGIATFARKPNGGLILT